MAIPIQESNGGVRFAVKVHRLARKNAITGELGDALQSFLNLTTVEGRAHAGLDRVLRETFEAAALFRYRKRVLLGRSSEGPHQVVNVTSRAQRARPVLSVHRSPHAIVELGSA